MNVWPLSPNTQHNQAAGGAGTSRAVLLPGTGSDEVFVTEVFRRPLAAVGIRLCAPREGHSDALDIAAADGPVLTGGVSAGAHLAARWAAANPERCAGLLLAMPGWTGKPGDAPAALAARLTADAVRRDGLEQALSNAAAGVPRWLADELDRAWRRYGSRLAPTMDAAALRDGPWVDELRRIGVPAGVAACSDDPVHPAAVAEEWAGALPVSALRFVTLGTLAADRSALGRAAVLAWLRAGGRPR